MSKYIKGWMMPLFIVLHLVGFSHGGWGLALPLAIMLMLFVLGDWLLPHDVSEPHLQQSWMLNVPMYTILPLLVLTNGIFLLLLGDGDPWGLIGWMQQDWSVDLAAARAATDHPLMWATGVLSLALINATGGTVAGHELVHRTAKPFDQRIGRWLLTFTADTTFAIEHVYGHHVRVATLDDPATARRGESFYQFTRRSTIECFVHAYQLDRARMKKLNLSPWNVFKSPFMMGNLENAVWFVIAFFLAGWTGFFIWLLIAFLGKQILEITNYFEHYGLVRDPATPTQPHHSWNSNHWMSANLLYSLARHSHHHAEAEAPYWTLRAHQNAPTLPLGYLSMLFVVLLPPLFKAIMAPALHDWDERFATPKERALAKAAEQTCRLR